MTAAESTAPKGMDAAEVSRGFFAVQLDYADMLSARSGIDLADAITYHTNFHRLFAYGNLAKDPPAKEFLFLVRHVAGEKDATTRLDHLVAAYARRPPDPWPPDRIPFGNCFACEAPTPEGVLKIHFRNGEKSGPVGPLHISRMAQRRADLTEMFGYVAKTYPFARRVTGASWLYNTEGYRRLFPIEFTASRTALMGPRSTHGLSHWGQFVDFRGYAKPDVAATFRQNLQSLDPDQPWLCFPYPVLNTTAPFEAFRDEYGL